MIKKILRSGYGLLESMFISIDKRLLRRTRNLRMIPNIAYRRGGKVSYGEWTYVVGIFQTILNIQLGSTTNNRILDIGCGTGLLGIASEPFLGDKGKYIGIDILSDNIEFCRNHFLDSRYVFHKLNAQNPHYILDTQTTVSKRYPIEDKTIDMVTALSVWTHFNEDDAKFYFTEIDRVLKENGKAIVTFFLMDDTYEETLPFRSAKKSRFHNTFQNLWEFTKACSHSKGWFTPVWVKTPEEAIGVTQEAINKIVNDTQLCLIETYTGSWKEVPGVYFQDILVFSKSQKRSPQSNSN